jgi:hypothetical protein
MSTTPLISESDSQKQNQNQNQNKELSLRPRRSRGKQSPIKVLASLNANRGHFDGIQINASSCAGYWHAARDEQPGDESSGAIDAAGELEPTAQRTRTAASGDESGAVLCLVEGRRKM